MLSIKQRQLNLYYNGYYYTGALDGVEGSKLKAAYGSFQKDNNLTVDKIYGAKTEAKLIEKGKELQNLLNECGADLKVDGLVGTKTISAIKTFQKANNLVQDGIVGSKTLQALETKANTDDWTNIKYFKREEFACPCGNCGGFPVEPDMKMVALMDKIRENYGEPITITSGIRCQTYNDSLSGSIKSSMHIQGKASDFYIPNQNDTSAGRTAVVNKAYNFGAKYSYANTVSMGKAVHVNI
jgi:peptidoglycan hydrolase-like protein with peptidoglycan-binding domain